MAGNERLREKGKTQVLLFWGLRLKGKEEKEKRGTGANKGSVCLNEKGRGDRGAWRCAVGR